MKAGWLKFAAHITMFDPCHATSNLPSFCNFKTSTTWLLFPCRSWTSPASTSSPSLKASSNNC